MYPKPSKMLSVLYAGTLMGIISGIPFLNFLNCCCCAGIIGGGVLAVFFYKQNFQPQMPRLTSSDCLTVGFLAGIVGACISFLLSGIVLAIFGNIAKEFILHQLESSRFPIPPDALDKLEESLRDVRDGFSFINLIFSLITYPLFGLLGGLIGWAVFKPKYDPFTAPSAFQQQMQSVYPEIIQQPPPVPPTSPTPPTQPEPPAKDENTPPEKTE